MTTEDAQAAEKVALTDAERIVAEAIVDRVTWDDGTEYINVTDAARIVAEAVEDGYRQGLAEGQEQAETRDLSFDTKVAEAVERERAAWVAEIEALAAEGDRDNYSVRTYELRDLATAMLDDEVTP